MHALPEKQAQLLRYIIDRLNDGLPPTVREICRDFNIKSTSTAHKYLKDLVAKGYITMGEGTNRSIRLVGGVGTVSVPVMGTIAAGAPILAVEDIEEYIPFRYTKGSGQDLFALRVKGESMIEAAILEGDIIIAKRTPTAYNGEIVVALVEDEATVKTFYKEGNYFRLQPANSHMEPIIVDDVTILGRVIAVYRSFS